MRRWLLPLCLVGLIAAAWAVPYSHQCPGSAWDGSPAIARVGDECVYSHQYATYLRDLSLSLGLSGQGIADDQSPLSDYYTARSRLVSEFGMENAAFATLALESALYRAASSRGYIPSDGEVTVRMGQARERIGALGILVELHQLALASDFAAFRALLESPPARELLPVQGEEHLILLFEQAKEVDLSGATRALEIHASLLESFGPDRYWTEVYIEDSRRVLAIDALSSAVIGSGTTQASALDWQTFRESTWAAIDIGLTDAAPSAISLPAILSYMSEIDALQRDFLEMQQTGARPGAPTPTPSPTSSARP